IDIREKEIEKMYGEEEIFKKDFKTSENQMKELEIRIFRHRSLLEEKRKILKDMDEVRYQRMVSINQKKADQTNLNTLGQRVSEEQNNLLLAISTLDQQRQELLRKLQIQQEQEVELNKIINQKKTLLENNIGLFDTNETEIKRLETLISELKFERETLNVKLKRSPIEKIKNLFQERYHGLIFEGIKIDTGFEIAVCAALGEIINFYLVDHIGEEDILSLKDAGRIGFLLKANVENPVLRSNSLLNYVHLNDPLTPLKRYLNNFIIVSDLTSGLAASREEPDSFFVTKDGVVIHGGMVIINGPPEDIATMHHKIEQLTEQIENLNNESLFRTQERTRLETERRQIEKELDQARHDLMHLATEIAGLEVKIGEIDSQQERNHHQVAILKDEIKEIKNQLTAIENELAQSLELDEKSYETIALEIKHLEDEIIKDEDEYRRLIDATSEVRTTLARIEEKVNSLNREIAELKNQYQSSQEEVAQLEQSNLHLEEEESAIDDSLKKLVDDVNLRKSALAEKEKDYSVQNMEHKIKIQEELLSALNDLRSNLETKREDLLKARMALFETEQQLKQCLDQSQQEYGVDLKTAPIEEIENVEEKHAELVARIERLGPINPLSITEYETEKKRLDELLRQRDDVIAAKNTIEASIKELDQEAKESFNKTFQMVREEFKKVFQNFFVGGEADIYLVDETAPFESDIEIVARPMGKKLKHIGQLSGGERTLLAISLLFAFYFVRPSPFCILDEIDAPLDDSNVLRFSEFIRNLSTRTQILLITHNKVTMEYADHIYGVTMEEPGVSKIVSVKLKEVTGALGKP
ncbi:MAG: hypothetical protein ABIL05_02975, partial [candidate division WOR-3 bacterium]